MDAINFEENFLVDPKHMNCLIGSAILSGNAVKFRISKAWIDKRLGHQPNSYPAAMKTLESTMLAFLREGVADDSGFLEIH